ncbi:MAG: hypothetical protein ABI386_12830 [Rhodanobacter sp.]
MNEQPKRDGARAVIQQAVQAPMTDTRALLNDDGEMRPGRGWISSTIALSLGFLCLLAVLAFHFPQ